MTVFYPRYVLTIYNAEYYGSTQSEPMPLLLTENEYWSLTSVDGATAEFMGLDVQQGADANGNLFVNPAYEDRQIEFALSVKPNKAKDAETYLSRYLRPGVPAILTNANIGDNFYLKGVISNWSMNRNSQSVTATIAFQPYDRAWYLDGVKIEDNLTTHKVVGEGDWIRVQTDLPALPEYVVDFTNKTTSTNKVTAILIELEHLEYGKDTSSITHNYKNFFNPNVSTGRILINLDLISANNTTLNLKASEIARIEVNTLSRSVALYYTQAGGVHGVYITKYISSMTNWDWSAPSGLVQLAVQIGTTDTTESIKSTATKGFVNPRFAVCPRTYTDAVDGKAFSSNLIPENIRKGVDILGIIGTAVVATGEIYDGETTITPTHTDRVLNTKGKTVGDDITVKGVPAYTGKTTVTPSIEEQILPTAEKLMDENDNITIKAVPVYTGSTTITPTDTDIVLDTADKMATSDITIKAVGSAVPAYTGETTVTPSSEQQTLATSGKLVNADITVEAISPVYEAENVEIIETTSDGEEQNITAVNQQYKVVPNVPSEGWYKAGQATTKAKTYQIAPAEQAKIIAGNIKKGVTILGVTGSCESGDSGITLNLPAHTYGFAYKITALDVSKLDMSNVTDYHFFFGGLQALASLTGLDTLDTSGATDMQGMFSACALLPSLNLTNFNTQLVTNMADMFNYCASLTSLDISHFNVQLVTDINSMFASCSKLQNVSLPVFTDKVTNTSRLFSDCTSLTTINATAIDTSKVENMSYMFNDCLGLTSLAFVALLNTSSTTDMSYMFNGCSGLTDLSLSSFVTSKVTNMTSMFAGCSGLTTLNLSPTTSATIHAFDTSLVQNMSNMFEGCSGLTTLHLDSFDTSNVYNMLYMFKGCTNLVTLNLGNNWGAGLQFYGSFDLSDCTSLSHASAVNILGKLAKTSNLLTITFAPAVKALLTDAEIKVATDKGWTVA